MTSANETAIKSIKLELDELNSKFLACLSEHDLDSMIPINAKISTLEAELLALNDSAVEVKEDERVIKSPESSKKDNLTAAEMLIAELEQNSIEQNSIEETSGQQNFAASATTNQTPEVVQAAQQPAAAAPVKSADAPATHTGSLADKFGNRSQSPASASKARESMFKAAKRAQERQTEDAVEIKKADDKLDEALLVKQMVEHTTSFLDLFFNPSKFISKQLEKQSKAQDVSAKTDGTMNKNGKAIQSSNFEASPDVNLFDASALELRNKLEKFCFYELLSVNQTASSDEISRAFLDKQKSLRTRFQDKKDLQEWQLRELVRVLNRAVKVLGDNGTRKKYDLSLLGLHEFEKYPADKTTNMAGTLADKLDAAGDRPLLSLSQLLVISGLMSTEELAKAEARGNTVNNRRLIEHLIDAELATFDEISAVILAQSLLAKDRLSMSQFKLAMDEMRSNSIRFVDTLVAEGWLTAEDLSATR